MHPDSGGGLPVQLREEICKSSRFANNVRTRAIAFKILRRMLIFVVAFAAIRREFAPRVRQEDTLPQSEEKCHV